MIEVDPSELKRAVESQYEGTFAQSVPVKEVFGGQTVWEGVVHVFDLAGNPKAKRAFAWLSPIEGSANRRFYAVLQLGVITGPHEAVRAAIVAAANTSKSSRE